MKSLSSTHISWRCRNCPSPSFCYSVEGITFEDFEVAAVSLNKVDGLEIVKNNVKGNRKDVPVVGSYSAARFISQYGPALKEKGYKMMLRGEEKTAAELYDNLIASINTVYEDVVHGNGEINMKEHPVEYELYDNPFKVIDGPA